MNYAENFRALKYRNFRLYLIGQGISLIGTWMQSLASGWLIYKISNSAVLLGTLGFLQQIPTLFLSPLAGVIIDRSNRKKLLITTQTLLMLQATVLAILVLMNQINSLELLILNLILGVIGSFDNVIRQSFFADLVDDVRDLPNAIALNSTLINVTRFVGPAVAGSVIALFGEGACFAANAISFIPVIIAMMVMNLNSVPVVNRDDPWHALVEGFKYTFSHPLFVRLILLAGILSLLVMPFQNMLPIFAKDILKGDASTQGYLLSAMGVGAIIGSLFLGSRTSLVNLPKHVVTCNYLQSVFLIGFCWSRYLILSLMLVAGLGFGMIVSIAGGSTIIQGSVDGKVRGRVMSFYYMAFLGMVPIGNLFSGFTSQIIGTSWTLTLGALICMAGVYAIVKIRPPRRGGPNELQN